jgi:regulator of sirC expression with transglutaminase-like and TPR domain
MSARADLTLFTHVVCRPEAELDLGQAALVIAEPEYPGLDVAHYVDMLDELGAQACGRLLGSEAPLREAQSELALRRILRLVYQDLGFRGNAEDYYDPRNSFLNEVLERRVGIPITLAVVLVEVCARAGVAARGVSFPGHFLVRAPGARGSLWVDPFDGRVLTATELRVLHERFTGQVGDPDPRLLEPAPKAQIVLRMLNNLRAIYGERGDQERLRGVLERIALLAPSEPLDGEPAQLAPRGRPVN